MPEAMRASKFLLAESSHPTKQMAVRRAYGKASGGNTKPPPTNLVEMSTAGTSTVSPLMNSPQRQQAASSQISTPRRSPGGSQSPKSKPKPRLIRRNSRAIQKARVNKLAQSDFAKRALKRATKWYAREVKKEDGLSSYEISKRVKSEYDGIGPHPATICCYLNANLAGMSPLKPGVMGDVPASSFKLLCVAFESYVRICRLNTEPPEADVWIAADEENLVKMANQEIDMSETYLGRYAGLQKRNAVSAVLDFTDEEWESLKTMKEADTASRSNTAVADAVDNDTGGFLTENETLGGELGAV